MNIKYVSLFALLFVSVAHGITSDQIIDVAYGRFARAHQALLKCQQSKDFWGRPSQCINEKNIFATKSDEFNKVLLKPKEFLNRTIQEGNKATLFQRSKKTKANMATKAMNTIKEHEQHPDKYYSSDLSRELLWQSSNNLIDMPGDKEACKQFNRDLYNSIPNDWDYDFIRTY